MGSQKRHGLVKCKESIGCWPKVPRLIGPQAVHWCKAQSDGDACASDPVADHNRDEMTRTSASDRRATSPRRCWSHGASWHKRASKMQRQPMRGPAGGVDLATARRAPAALKRFPPPAPRLCSCLHGPARQPISPPRRRPPCTTTTMRPRHHQTIRTSHICPPKPGRPASPSCRPSHPHSLHSSPEAARRLPRLHALVA